MRIKKTTQFESFLASQLTQQFTAINTKIYNHSVVAELNYTLAKCHGHSAVNGQSVHKIDFTNAESIVSMEVAREGRPAYRIFRERIDCCKFLESSYKRFNLAEIVLKELKKMKNFPRRCPVKAYTPIILDCLQINWRQLAIYLPNITFKATTEFFTNGKKFSEIIFKGTTMQQLRINASG
ncbi:uncharacterized protein LOC129242160 [Anastrepha obliqua]|uniref:uncharacterized protein LOC129242160 n=1 Tax=Anastrepha obliqua TaxID=95512 RepID=UPI00240930C8|nr:uncharacterized protein LOC129242160 [Anastrepha obliqua]